MKPSQKDTAIYPDLIRYLQARLEESSQIPDDRRQTLDRVSTYVAARVRSGEPALLTFICTHNARRSQMAQIWAHAAARFFSLRGVAAYSGGTEATAFDPRAVSAMVRAGFRVERHSKEVNPEYLVHAGSEIPPVSAFSKAYHDPSNPQHGFCAVLTCSSADRECPVIPRADRRVLVPYEDPKSSAGTDREAEVYDERCREICREMVWLFARAAGGDDVAVTVKAAGADKAAKRKSITKST
ncbi:MAG: protein-tyrosine-phosphatase [Gemmatimonadetes bacterium]|nr:protein-tyrosine-phosphatase [Gemmatimonadota bacterium]MYD26415.1 protein-tyrosine-phosphatase [Gemmatimonadota bacterium]MYJ00311.1 protein-tyrosine-phosphatase [Gemmatimonadota bacterium]